MKPIEVGSFEAKNRLSELLARAEKGQKIYITRRGKRVAILSPAGADEEDVRKSLPSLIKELRTFRARAKRGPEPLKRLIEEGRR